MNPIPIRARCRCLMILLLALLAYEAGAQTRSDYLDSLHTFAYLKHRLHLCRQRFDIPQPALRCLNASAAKADSLAKRWRGDAAGPGAYLPYWAAHPELDETEARAKYGFREPANGDCAVDSTGYTIARRRLTILETAVFNSARLGDTQSVIALLDTMGQEFPFTAAIPRAKRLAIARRDTAAYLRLLLRSRYENFAAVRRGELTWSQARTPEQKAFVEAGLRLVDTDAIPKPRPEPAELRRWLTGFADLHTISSNCIFGQRRMPLFLQRHKRKLREVYCNLVEESYTAMPGLLCRYLSTPDSLRGPSMREMGYFSLHLIQLNGFGQIYPDSVFETHFSLLRQLAYAGAYDMENYVSARDEYLNVVKGRLSEFGYRTWRDHSELGYAFTNTPEVTARREAWMLPRLEVIEWK